MGLMFVKKKFHDMEQEPISTKESREDVVSESVTSSPKEPVVKNKKGKAHKNMITAEQLAAVEAAAEELAPKVKKVKSDRGLIERTESSKIILAEDNRQLLKD